VARPGAYAPSAEDREYAKLLSTLPLSLFKRVMYMC